MEPKIDLRGVTRVFFNLSLVLTYLFILALFKPISIELTASTFIVLVISVFFFCKKHRKAPISKRDMMVSIISNAVIFSLLELVNRYF